jgi:hypothetical protein
VEEAAAVGNRPLNEGAIRKLLEGSVTEDVIRYLNVATRPPIFPTSDRTNPWYFSFQQNNALELE